ncbi:L,D-transpeptidase [Rhizobium sp. Root1220]|uniref:L,D-transpeptidase n=1 Tax=Rhizobium sp. Root1220 TaxID=1736432 RepID=UPI0006F33B85|nr:L,D-transpeptidase [Rhizobium sp. Root1220]KQV68316.1 oxidoreductase [Rhizobium sp. Root1220]
MDNNGITRRGIVLSGLALLASGCTTPRWPFETPYYAEGTRLNPRYRRREVVYNGDEPLGTIVVNTAERSLYLVEPAGMATRYAVAVGEEGLTLKGRATIGRKAEWPSWTPTASMIERKPRLAEYAGGVPGGPNNPLGAAALYLYRGSQDTYFRLHGTNEPWLIGQAVSNGCIRLTNEDIVHLYSRVPIGTPVLVV